YVEALTENFLGRGGRPLAVLERVRRDSQVVLHGVSLSIGAVDPLNEAYLSSVRELAGQVEAAWVSDHLCFGTFQGSYGHDLWPLPYTEEALAHVVSRVQHVQERLGRELALENVSSYVEYRDSTLTEWEFLVAVAERSGCRILLDVNNVYVSSRNHGFDPEAYLDAIPRGSVAQIHLAGHSDHGTHVIDDHGSRVPEAVWALYRHTVQRLGAIPAIIEWDSNVPALTELQAESQKARAAEAEVLDAAL
ncbi:MAG: DUF692 domain-containing protein, partial [Deltaproteobacteria bacterium]|nr:DUF692 domain-containing protein [Deltaproteobacteria bacterium]